jgi:hypothetical protein
MIEEGRVGCFRLSGELIYFAEPKDLLKLMGNFFIVRAEHLFYSDHIEYVAYSPLFGLTDQGEEVPNYTLLIHSYDCIEAVRD